MREAKKQRTHQLHQTNSLTNNRPPTKDTTDPPTNIYWKPTSLPPPSCPSYATVLRRFVSGPGSRENGAPRGGSSGGPRNGPMGRDTASQPSKPNIQTTSTQPRPNTQQASRQPDIHTAHSKTPNQTATCTLASGATRVADRTQTRGGGGERESRANNGERGGEGARSASTDGKKAGERSGEEAKRETEMRKEIALGLMEGQRMMELDAWERSVVEARGEIGGVGGGASLRSVHSLHHQASPPDGLLQSH